MLSPGPWRFVLMKLSLSSFTQTQIKIRTKRLFRLQAIFRQQLRRLRSYLDRCQPFVKVKRSGFNPVIRD